MSSSAPITMLIPDFPFPYDEYVRHPAGIGSVPSEAYGRKVAVVGAAWPVSSQRTSS